MLFKHGLIFGKMMPVHAGHVYLIEQARKQCDKLTIFICTLEREPIPVHLRQYWLNQIFPDVEVIHCRENLPQYPYESPNFWETWVEIVRKYISSDVECLFTSEDYGIEFARRLGIMHIMIDKQRETVPISGTLVRAEPYKYWDYIPAAVRPYFTKKVVLVGPESTGKTKTSEILAKHYNTLWVREYGREYTDRVKNLNISDFSNIAVGQLDLEQITALKAAQQSKLLICDTDLIVTQIWGEIFLNCCPQWIVEANANNNKKYDLYLLMNTDIPWVNDGTREFNHIREWHFHRLERELIERQINYVVISGKTFEERTRQAIVAVDELMKNVI